MSGPLTVSLSKGEIVCAAGERNCDLFLIQSGKLLVFVNDGTKITPLAYLNPGEYMGELSFFDHEPRSANVVCIEDTTLIIVPVKDVYTQIPYWITSIAKSITRKLREKGELARVKGIRRKNVESVKPLEIDEQRDLYQKLEEHLDKLG